MPTIQDVKTTPEYISNFINSNLQQLKDIHDGGMIEHKEGCLGFKCSEKENTMDVFFMNREFLVEQMTLESWENLKSSVVKDKRLFFINDIDRNSVFLVYI